jgi:hypothetical protein
VAYITVAKKHGIVGLTKLKDNRNEREGIVAGRGKIAE